MMKGVIGMSYSQQTHSHQDIAQKTGGSWGEIAKSTFPLSNASEVPPNTDSINSTRVPGLSWVTVRIRVEMGKSGLDYVSDNIAEITVMCIPSY
jgi:hypothetical protein